MLSIFSQMRDLHTAFVLPEPFRSATAYLPFRLEACTENGRRKYVVSELMSEAPRHQGFDRGTEVTHGTASRSHVRWRRTPSAKPGATPPRATRRASRR
jgi:hypothetical protein